MAAVALLFQLDFRRGANPWLILAFASPFLIHGLLGGQAGTDRVDRDRGGVRLRARHRRRPRVWQVVAGGVALGALMLALVANRGSIYFGSDDFGVSDGVDSYATKAVASNEFIYGAAIVNLSDSARVHYWGGRYVAVVFIRPIPRTLWPGKYRFASEWLGIPNFLDVDAQLGMGTLPVSERTRVGQLDRSRPRTNRGPVVGVLVGGFGGPVPDRTVSSDTLGGGRSRGDPFWRAAYTLAGALSAYLIAQTLEAMLFRFLLTSGAIVVGWRIAEGRLPQFFPPAPPSAPRVPTDRPPAARSVS